MRSFTASSAPSRAPGTWVPSRCTRRTPCGSSRWRAAAGRRDRRGGSPAGCSPPARLLSAWPTGRPGSRRSAALSSCWPRRGSPGAPAGVAGSQCRCSSLAMLCKESVLVAPLVLAFVLGRRGRLLSRYDVRCRHRRVRGLRVASSDARLNLESPYATAYDSTLLVNLATLWIWFLEPVAPLSRPPRRTPAGARAPRPRHRWSPRRLPGLHARPPRPARWGLRVSGSWCCFFPCCRSGSTPTPTTPTSRKRLPRLGGRRGGEAGATRSSGSPAWLLGLGVAAVAASVLCAARTTRAHETLTLPNSAVPHDSVVRYGRAAGALVAAVREARLPPAWTGWCS